MASLIYAAGAATYDRIQKIFTARRERKEANAALFAQQEAANAARIAALQANTCLCSSSDWDGRSHNDGCAQAAAAARERERGGLNNEPADIEVAEPNGPPPVYMLVDENGQMMVDKHGRKQRWQGRGLRALFQRKRGQGRIWFAWGDWTRNESVSVTSG